MSGSAALGLLVGWLAGAFLYGFVSAAYTDWKVRRLTAPSH